MEAILSGWMLLSGLYEVREALDLPPPVTDAMLFPPADMALLQFYRASAHRDLVTARWPLYPHRDIEFFWMSLDADERVEIWKLVVVAVEPAHSDDYRRCSLQRLLKLLGPNAYYAGVLPDPAPYCEIMWYLPSSPRPPRVAGGSMPPAP